MLEYSKKYGELLWHYRQKAGISLEELSKELDYGTRSLVLWERGLQIPENRWHKRFVELYGITGDDAEFILKPRPELTVYEEEIVIPGLQNEYRLLQISDSHVIVPDEDASAERLDYEVGRISDFSEDGLNSVERMELVKRYIDNNRLDGVLLTGDIIDCPFKASIEYLNDFLESLPVPYMYVLGNHDWHFADQSEDDGVKSTRPRFKPFTGGDTSLHKKKIGELTLIGLDFTRSRNGVNFYEDGIAKRLAAAVSDEKNVLVLQHCPFSVPTLSDDCKAWWHGNDIKNGAEEDPFEENKRVLDILCASGSPVRALIAGDLHFFHKDLLRGTLPQYICLNTSGGGATLFHIHG